MLGVISCCLFDLLKMLNNIIWNGMEEV